MDLPDAEQAEHPCFALCLCPAQPETEFESHVPAVMGLLVLLQLMPQYWLQKVLLQLMMSQAQMMLLLTMRWWLVSLPLLVWPCVPAVREGKAHCCRSILTRMWPHLEPLLHVLFVSSCP